MKHGKNIAVVAMFAVTITTQVALGDLVVPVTTIGATPTPGTEVVNQWYFESPPTGTGTITTAPLGSSFGPDAAQLTLPSTPTNAQVNIYTAQDFGLASSVLNNLNLSYDYYKASSPNGTPAAAPSLKLTIYAAGGTGDNYGNLVYEPYLQTSGFQNPLTNTWVTETVNPTTGATHDSYGGWWWTGGFGILDNAGSGGGQPYRSLAEWATAFASSDPTDFANAHVLALQVGLGSNNPDVVAYFDGVSFSIGAGPTTTYDFSAVPEPSMAFVGFALVGAFGFVRRRYSRSGLRESTV